MSDRDNAEVEQINEPRENDKVTVELTGKVVDGMDQHDDIVRIDVGGQKVEILLEEIVDIERELKPISVEGESGDD